MPVIDPGLVDPYLDTAGPEYSWLHMSCYGKIGSGGAITDNISGFQFVREH
jgi:hypothetical protein